MHSRTIASYSLISFSVLLQSILYVGCAPSSFAQRFSQKQEISMEEQALKNALKTLQDIDDILGRLERVRQTQAVQQEERMFKQQQEIQQKTVTDIQNTINRLEGKPIPTPHSPAPAPTPAPTPPAPTPPAPTPPAPTPPAPTPPAPPPVGSIPPGTPVWPLNSTGCPLFPNAIWNTPVTNCPVDPNSATYINYINVVPGNDYGVHPDFGSMYNGGMNGMYINIAAPNQPEVAVTYTLYGNESDSGPAPIPNNSIIEGAPIPSGNGPPTPDQGGGDAHLLVLQPSTNILWEFWKSSYNGDGTWTAANGAMWDVSSCQERPNGWTSADASGMPITPTSVKYEEAASGSINHAIRLTVNWTGWESSVWPATHSLQDTLSPGAPPMGQYFRLKSQYDTDTFQADTGVYSWSPTNRAIVHALATYGCVIQDINQGGSPFYIEGCYSNKWNDDDLHLLGYLRVSMFEAIDVSQLAVDPTTSYEAIQPGASSGGGGGGNLGVSGGSNVMILDKDSHHTKSAPRLNK